MNRMIASVALSVGLMTAPAIAAEIELTKEIQGASIHETGVDMAGLIRATAVIEDSLGRALPGRAYQGMKRHILDQE